MTDKPGPQHQSATPKPAISLSQPGILQRTCECGAAPGLTGECETCASTRLSRPWGAPPPAAPGRPRSNETMRPGHPRAGEYRFKDLTIHPKERLGIQPKLTIGQPNDKYEQEADRVAEQVMRMPDPRPWVQRMERAEWPGMMQQKPLVNRITPLVQRQGEASKKEEEETVQAKPIESSSVPVLQKQGMAPEAEERKEDEEALEQKPLASPLTSLIQRQVDSPDVEEKEEEEEPVQAKENLGEFTGASATLEARLHASKGSGELLPKQTRAFMESRFGQDFSRVRVHADGEAAQLNQEIQAQAFTHRQDVYFGAGKYSPESMKGKRLLAHELTHVVQQTGTVQRQSSTPVIKPSETTKEKEKAFPPNFTPEEEAQKLYEAFKGWGTDERAVMDILSTGRQDMTRAIERAYDQLYSPSSLKKRLPEELSGEDLIRARKLLGQGKLDLSDKVRAVMRDVMRGQGLNTEKLFHALDRASKQEVSRLKSDSQLTSQLKVFLPTDEWQFVETYLTHGKGILAAKLRSAVRGLGTDEKAIWRALEQASPAERKFVLEQKKLLNDVKDDLSGEDWIRFERTLASNFGNLDRIETAALGWGTNEAALKGAIAGLTGEDFKKLANKKFEGIEGQGIEALSRLLEAEFSGSDLTEAKEILHQKRLAFDKTYKERYFKAQTGMPGDTAPQSLAGASVLVADTKKGESLSVIGKLKVAAAGVGTDEQAIWHTLNSLTDEQRKFIRERNPEGVLNVLRKDLSDSEYQRAMKLLAGGVASIKAGIKQAIGGWGTDKRLLYDAVDRAVKDRKIAQELLADPDLNRSVRIYVEPKQYQLFQTVLKTGNFTPLMRLQWATTAMVGTDEDLVFELCKQYGKQWFTGSKADPSVDKDQAVNTEVNTILKSELSTRDYWKALDLMRGEPKTEEERLARAKELLERERGGVSTAIMDNLSFTGENADDAWREYRATYNRALDDGKISKEEQKELRKDERYSKEMTEEYREAKSTVAQWATNIAVAIVGIAATLLTGGTAGPFVAALAAKLGGATAVVVEGMVLAAALKVGLNRAIQGEGYDETSAEALVDAVSAGVEIGLSVVGGHLATRFMQGGSKTALARSVGPSVEKAFGKAGTRILNVGLEGTIDATVGGVGEGVIQGMANEKTWASGMEGFFKNMGASVGVNTLMSGVGGFIGGAGFKSIGEAVGSRLKGKVSDEPIIKAEEPKLETPKVDEPTVKVEGSKIKVTEPTASLKATATKEFSNWKEGLNPETQKFLDRNPALAKVYAEMDSDVRQILTLCQSSCIPEFADQVPGLGDRIKTLMKDNGLRKNHAGLQKLLHGTISANALDSLVDKLKQLAAHTDSDTFARLLRDASWLGRVLSEVPSADELRDQLRLIFLHGAPNAEELVSLIERYNKARVATLIDVESRLAGKDPTGRGFSPAVSRGVYGKNGGKLIEPSRVNLVFPGGAMKFKKLLLTGDVGEGVELALEELSNLYKRNAQTIHENLKERLRTYFKGIRADIEDGGNGGLILYGGAGTPGTHAEIQTLNDAFHLGEPDPLLAVRRIKEFATAKSGDPFERCPHCKGITKGIRSATDEFQ